MFVSSRRVSGRTDGGYDVRGRDLEVPEFASNSLHPSKFHI